MAEKIENRILSRLLGLMAHDMRNPLSALQSNVSYLGSMLGASVDADVREALEDTAVSCESMAHLIDNFELLGIALSGSANYPQSSFDVGSLIVDAMTRAQMTAASHGVRLEVDSAGSQKRVMALGNRDMLARALENLIRNAIQYSPSREPVKVALEQGKEELCVLVSDAGQRLDDKHRSVAFSAEGQILAKGIAGGRYSRGLGLLCADICARLAGGRVEAGEAESANVFRLCFRRAA